MAQLCLLDAYINKKTKAASICDAVEHLDHMIKVAGIDHVGIGTDFDGGGGLQGCRGDNDLINLTIKMIEKGYTEEDLRKIWGGNLLRVNEASTGSTTSFFKKTQIIPKQRIIKNI